MKAILLVLFILAIILAGCVHKRTNLNIRIKGDDWQKSDVHLPVVGSQTRRFRVSETPHLYKLEREKYRINIEINPKEHGHPVNLQISTVGKRPPRKISVISSWGGDCGKIGNWGDNLKNAVFSWGWPFFTNPKAVGFLWYPGTGYCTQGLPQTPEQASKFPIELKIYDDTGLLGEEKIEIEVFQNGYLFYIVTP